MTIDELKALVEECRLKLPANEGKLIKGSKTGPIGIGMVDLLITFAQAQDERLKAQDERIETQERRIAAQEERIAAQAQRIEALDKKPIAPKGKPAADKKIAARKKK